MKKKEHKGGGNGQVAVAVAVVGCASTRWEKNPWNGTGHVDYEPVPRKCISHLSEA